MIAAAVALLLAAPTAPLACPPGATRHGAAPPEAFEEWCEGKDPAGGPDRRDGPSRTYYDDGALWLEETWRAGQRHGAFVEWYRGGGKAREGAFTDGHKSGRWTTWWESGRVEEEADWLGGARHGRFASYWSTGKPRAEGRHCGGAQCGTWRTFDEAGREIGKIEYVEQTLVP